MARRDDEYLKTNLKRKKRCLWFALADFIVFGGSGFFFTLFGINSSSDGLELVGFIALYFFLIFPVYAILHGILSSKVTGQVILPNLIFCASVFLFFVCVYETDFGLSTFSEKLLRSICPSIGYTVFSAVSSLAAKMIMKENEGARPNLSSSQGGASSDNA